MRSQARALTLASLGGVALLIAGCTSAQVESSKDPNVFDAWTSSEKAAVTSFATQVSAGVGTPSGYEFVDAVWADPDTGERSHAFVRFGIDTGGPGTQANVDKVVSNLAASGYPPANQWNCSSAGTETVNGASEPIYSCRLPDNEAVVATNVLSDTFPANGGVGVTLDFLQALKNGKLGTPTPTSSAS